MRTIELKFGKLRMLRALGDCDNWQSKKDLEAKLKDMPANTVNTNLYGLKKAHLCESRTQAVRHPTKEGFMDIAVFKITEAGKTELLLAANKSDKKKVEKVDTKTEEKIIFDPRKMVTSVFDLGKF